MFVGRNIALGVLREYVSVPARVPSVTVTDKRITPPEAGSIQAGSRMRLYSGRTQDCVRQTRPSNIYRFRMRLVVLSEATIPIWSPKSFVDPLQAWKATYVNICD